MFISDLPFNRRGRLWRDEHRNESIYPQVEDILRGEGFQKIDMWKRFEEFDLTEINMVDLCLAKVSLE